MEYSNFAGVVDSSGIRVWYTDTSREHDAGILLIGHHTVPLMVIPPNAKNFTVTGFINEDCTNRVSRV